MKNIVFYFVFISTVFVSFGASSLIYEKTFFDHFFKFYPLEQERWNARLHAYYTQKHTLNKAIMQWEGIIEGCKCYTAVLKEILKRAPTFKRPHTMYLRPMAQGIYTKRVQQIRMTYYRIKNLEKRLDKESPDNVKKMQVSIHNRKIKEKNHTLIASLWKEIYLNFSLDKK